MKNSINSLRLILTVFATSVYFSGAAFAQSSVAQPNSLDARVAQSKAALKLQLTSAQSQKISQKCSGAQNMIKTITAKDKLAADKRQQTYTNLSTQLTTEIRLLQNQGSDITELKSAQMQFDTALNRYLADVANYKTAMEDIVALNCTTDPVGFESLLTNARQLRVSLATDTAQVKTAKNALVQALSTVATSLKSDQAESN
jgi:hypothetical protein